MKIAIISTVTQGWGGSEELWSQFALFCRKRGVYIKVFTFLKSFNSSIWNEIINAGIDIKNIPLHQLPGNSLFEKIISKLRRQQLTVKYKNRFLELSTSDWDHVIISQGGTNDIIYYNDLYEVINGLNKPFTVINQGQKETQQLNDEQRTMLKNIFLKTSSLLFVSGRSLRSTERFLARSLTHAGVIKNPVNINNTQLVEWPEGDKLKMAIVSRLDIAKGHDILLASLAKEEWNTRNFELNIFGEGPDDMFIRELINFYKLNDKVVMKGFCSDVKSIWAANHILVLPSLGEGMPLVLIESALCGRPALCTDVGGCSEFIRNHESGFIAPYGSVNGLNIALNEVWVNKNKLKEMGMKAKSNADEFLPGNAAKDLFEKIFNE